MTALRYLGLCGILSSIISAVGGLIGDVRYVGLASVVMLSGNVIAFTVKGKRP